MTAIKSNDLIEQFAQQIESEYPDIDLQEIKLICNSPWTFLKDEMESGELNTVRFKYFGTFQVYLGRAKNMLNNLKKKFQVHKIEPEEFFRIKEMLEKFISNEEN